MKDDTFTSQDVVRIYQKHLDLGERQAVDAFFAGLGIPTDQRFMAALSERAANHRLTVLKAWVLADVVSQFTEKVDNALSDGSIASLREEADQLQTSIENFDQFRRDAVEFAGRIGVDPDIVRTYVNIGLPIRATMRQSLLIIRSMLTFFDDLPREVRELLGELRDLEQVLETLQSFLDN